MLSNINQTINISATSITGDETGANQIILYLNAQISTDGNFNINQSIRDKELYLANIETAEADVRSFTDYVVELSQK